MAVQTIDISVVHEVAARRLAACNAQTSLAARPVSQSGSARQKFFAGFAGAGGIRRASSLLGRLASRFGMRRLALSLPRAVASQNADPGDHWVFAKRLLTHESDAMPIDRRQQLQKELLTSLGIAAQSKAPRIRAAATIAFADALYRAGEYPEALALIDKALTGASGEARLLRIKANCLVALGRPSEGRAFYERMLALDPANGELARKVEILAPLVADSPKTATSGRCQSKASILIGIGGGIGDALHVAPAIRNIARRSGERVDVLVLADHAGSEFLVRNPQYVDRTWIPCEEVLDTRYRAVFLTHSFGPMRFPFRADRICVSRDWRPFRPGLLNETLFNLEAMKQLLGVQWENADAEEYFAEDLGYRRPAEELVGINAGSKAGRWLSKRWPHFSELASRLAARGIRVASFGTPDEHVEGTENRTGGTVEQMCRSMLDCTHFVSNDSGPMHIANALGIPVLALFAPTDAVTHLPLRRTTVALSLAKRCSPCEVKDHKYFASGFCRCVGEISASEVEQKLMSMLQDAPAQQILVSDRNRQPDRTEGIVT